MTVVSMQTDNTFTPYPVRRLKKKPQERQHNEFTNMDSEYEDSLLNLQKADGCCNMIKAAFSPDPYINWVYEKVMIKKAVFDD